MDAVSTSTTHTRGKTVECSEQRNFLLNKDKAMRKKHSACNRDAVDIKYTGGGICLSFNTGMYEVLRGAVDAFFVSTEMNDLCIKTLVHDKKQRNVETKYKVSCGDSTYTLNMYHTTSSCLVNGKKVACFLDIHLPAIMHSIETELAKHGITIADVNEALETILSDSPSTPDVGEGNITLIDIDSEVQLKVTDDLRTLLDETSTEELPQLEQGDAPSTDMTVLLQALHESVIRIENTLGNFITQTNKSFLQIRDELCSVKRQSKVNSEATDRHVEDLEVSTTQLKTSCDKNHDEQVRKLQAISDAVKLLNEKTTKPRSSTVVGADCPLNAFEKDVTKTQTKSKLLLIGDSIVRGTRTRDVHPSVEIDINPGKKLMDICSKLNSITMDPYHTVIIYAGGNDVPVRTPLNRMHDQLKQTIEVLRQSGCTVYVCTVCPRRDGSVGPINDMIRHVCGETGAVAMEVCSSFVYGDGTAVQHFFVSDGIHLSDIGQTKLIQCIERHVRILRTSADPSETTYQRTRNIPSVTPTGGSLSHQESYRGPRLPPRTEMAAPWNHAFDRGSWSHSPPHHHHDNRRLPGNPSSARYSTGQPHQGNLLFTGTGNRGRPSPRYGTGNSSTGRQRPPHQFPRQNIHRGIRDGHYRNGSYIGQCNICHRTNHTTENCWQNY